MDIADLKGRIPFEIIESLQKRGIGRLTPPQELSINGGLLSYANIVVSAPTASGKTLIAEIACVNSVLSRRKKAVYIAPMRALVTEKFNEFRDAYPYLKCAMSIGDMDSNDQWLATYDIIFLSTEKFDSLIRHGVDWLDSVGCAVFDEVHMLADVSRGPTLEILMTKLIATCRAQFIALSATIGNASDIARWMGAVLVESDYRTVKLSKGIVHNSMVYYSNGNDLEETMLDGTSQLPELRIVQDTLLQNKQILIFYSTKRNAEAGAQRIASGVPDMLVNGNSAELSTLSARILGALERPTDQCVKLSALVKGGVAFHHSGLLNQQRNAIENAFKDNIIKVICSTTTLGFGVNLPAHTVLVKDITRYSGAGSEMLKVNDVLQLFGRAGRPRYDTEGRALLIASSAERVNELHREYLLAKPEDIDSSLGIVPVLRSHILSFIAGNFLNTKESMQKFFERSFYGFQYRDSRRISEIIDEITAELEEWKMIVRSGGVMSATKLGSRVSELYIDPLSAKWMIGMIGRCKSPIDILYMICNTLEMRPYARVTAEAEDGFAAYAHAHGWLHSGEFDADRYESYDPQGAFSTAMMLSDWTEEVKEPEIVKKYHSTPGALYSKITNADWMIYSAAELSKILKLPAHSLIELRVRLRYGIKEELLDLVRLEQIGRARARALYINGIRSVADIRNNKARVTSILGREVSEKVFSQL